MLDILRFMFTDFWHCLLDTVDGVDAMCDRLLCHAPSIGNDERKEE